MEFANHAILIGALLVLLSMVVGSLSARTGAPLLLVFLAVGMLAGEEGPGHILFSDYQTAYLVGTMALLDHMFVPADDTEESEQQRFYGSFTLDGDAPLGEVADIHGVEVPERVRPQTLAQYIDRKFHRRPVVGDYISIGVMNLVVREIQGRNISKVGIVVRNR